MSLFLVFIQKKEISFTLYIIARLIQEVSKVNDSPLILTVFFVIHTNCLLCHTNCDELTKFYFGAQNWSAKFINVQIKIFAWRILCWLEIHIIWARTHFNLFNALVFIHLWSIIEDKQPKSACWPAQNFRLKK